MINTNYIFEFLKGYDKGRIQTLNLLPNQIIHGEVLELINEHQALISIKGSKVIAKLEVPLKKGDKSLFVVSSVTDDIKLRLVSDKANNLKNISEEIIRFIGLKNSKTNNQIVSFMVNNNIPVEKESVINIGNLVKEGFNTDNLLSALKILVNKKIPVTPLNLKILNDFLFGENILARLNNLQASYLQLSKPEKGLIATELKSHLELTIKNINDFFIGKPVIENQSIQTDKQAEVPKQIIVGKQLVDTQKIDTVGLKNSIIKFLEQIQLKPLPDTDINRQLETLKNTIEQLFIKKELLPKTFAQEVEKTFHYLAGQHFSAANESSMFSQTLIQIPNFLFANKEPVLIQVNTKNNEEGKIDPDDMLFVFLFNLDKLGTTILHLRVLGQQIFVKLYNDNPFGKEVFKQLEPDFVQFLKENGFQTTGIKVQSAIDSQIDDNKEYTSTVYSGVDIKI